MNMEGFSEVDFGLDLSPESLKHKKLVLIRHPKDMDVAAALQGRKIKIPKQGEASEPLLESSGTGTHNINYKLFVDKDPIHNTFRSIIKGGKMGPAFDASMSIVQFVDTGNCGAAPTTPAITAYSRVPQVRGLKPCLLPLGSDISQKDINARVAVIEGSSVGDNSSSDTGRTDLMSPKDKKKKKRKSEAMEEAEAPSPSTPGTASKPRKDKKIKRK
mmetsp:Transcript_28623/g.48334  ORF Transcript_28623/g.48334 Transcript_28623/m.48334 type:complete len:216 (+) Transcript_28623:59-706(+)